METTEEQRPFKNDPDTVTDSKEQNNQLFVFIQQISHLCLHHMGLFVTDLH